MADLNILTISLAVAAGILAGIVNTLAGSGSAITLPILVYLGVPANEANATNRIGVVVQNVAAVFTLQQRKSLNLSATDLWHTGIMAAGGIGGAALAADLNEEIMNLAIAGMLVVVLITILLKPEQWLRSHTEVPVTGTMQWSRIPLFLLIGAYGGFIQAGVGLFILSGLVLTAGYALVQANKVKLVAVLAFTVVALVVFLAQGVRLWWEIGLTLAVGQSMGAWLAARFMVENQQAKYWMRWLLIAVVVYSIVRFSPIPLPFLPG